MTTSKHTQGPFALTEDDGEFLVVAPNPNLPGCYGVLAQVFDCDFPDQALANGQLLAAAHDLLAALKALCSMPLFPLERDVSAFRDAANMAEDAIAKAEGK